MNTNVRAIKLWSLIAAACFAGGLGLTFVPEPTTMISYASQVLFLAFHLAVLPVIANLSAPNWVKASGYVWAVVDNVIVVMTINGVADDITWPMRLGIHIGTATWLLGTAISNPQTAPRFVGILAGVWLGGYSLVAPWVPMTAFYPAGLLLLLYFLVVAFTVKADTMTGTSTSTTTA